MIELYHFWDSPCCFKVRTVLAEKKLNWTAHLIASVKFDHFLTAYQAINPHSTAPTLIHDGQTLLQSSVIAEYLDDAFPENPLHPADPIARAVMRQWVFEEQAYFFPLIVIMSFNLMMTLRAQAYGMDQLKEWSKQHPDQNRAQDYLQRISSPRDDQAVAAAVDKFTWHVGRLEEQLETSGGPWVCGENYSLADISLGAILDRIESLNLIRVLDKAPRVANMFDQIKGRPAFQTAAPPFEYRMWGPTKPVPSRRIGAHEEYGVFPSG